VSEIRAATRRLLEGLDFCVVETSTGEEGLKLVRRLAPDLAIVGHRLPDLLVERVVRGLRETPRTRYLPVLVSCPPGFEGTERRCRAAGASGAVERPPDPAQLRKEVRKLLSPSRRRRLRTPVLVRRGRQEERASGLNLSTSGMLLEAGSQLRIGEKLLLSFYLPREVRPLSVLGEVVREAREMQHLSNAYGVTFRDLTRDDHSRITRFVRFLPIVPAEPLQTG
jgi:two-component system cell cycle response regulator DivK